MKQSPPCVGKDPWVGLEQNEQGITNSSCMPMLACVADDYQQEKA